MVGVADPFIVKEKNRMITNNPRHPHLVTVYRAETDSNGRPKTDDEGNEIIACVLSSVCGLRSMIRNLDMDAESVKADYRLSLPKHNVILFKGDTLIFENRINGEIKSGVLEESRVNNLGAKIWFNQKGNS